MSMMHTCIPRAALLLLALATLRGWATEYWRRICYNSDLSAMKDVVCFAGSAPGTVTRRLWHLSSDEILSNYLLISHI